MMHTKAPGNTSETVARIVSEPWTRSPEGWLGGVCQGLGERFGVDPNLIRLGWGATVLLFGSGILLYLALWWVLPRRDQMPAEPVIWTRHSDGRRAPPLARTVTDRKVLGVCGGLARRWGWDPALMRLACLSVATLSFGLAVVAYLIAAMFMPPAMPAFSPPTHPADF